MDPGIVAPALARWYRAHARDLPWRRTRDPWAILLSEVLLQQTRVETAAPAFARLLAQFPAPERLARASERDALRAWAGLGYYRRARALHATARVLVAEHGGRVPRGEEALAALPGIGPYTVAAVRAFAFDEPAAPLDANVVRVLARLGAERGEAGSRATRARLEAGMRALLRHGSPRELGQAVMELGALVCTPRPRCEACPVASACAARALGVQAEVPRVRPKPAPRAERWAFALVQQRDALLLEERGPGLLHGFWAPPGVRLAPRQAAPPALQARLGELGVRATVGPPGARGAWRFTHRTWAFTVHGARLRGGEAGDARWVRAADLDALPVAQPLRGHVERALRRRA